MVIKLSLVCLLAATPVLALPEPLRVTGKLTRENDELIVQDATATLLFEVTDRLDLQFQIPAAGALELWLGAAHPDTPEHSPAAGRFSIAGDKGGTVLSFPTFRFDTKWVRDRKSEVESLVFWPVNTPQNTNLIHQLTAAGIAGPRRYVGRWLRLRVEVEGRRWSVWLENQFLLSREAAVTGALVVRAPKGTRFKPVETLPPLDLREAQWIERVTDPKSYREAYDGGPPFFDDARMPMLRIPAADYVAAHLLAKADLDTNRADVLTLRVGRYGWNSQVVQHDFTARVPRTNDFIPVRVPLHAALAQDIERYFEVELTKEVRLAIRQDDGARHRRRPLGLPSGVTIAGITFERSPLQMRVTSAEPGHAFEEPQAPVFHVHLTNITEQTQTYRLTAAGVPLRGKDVATATTGSVAAGLATNVTLAVPAKARGYYDLVVTLTNEKDDVLLKRKTSFAVLPPNTRQHRATSPFGTWDFYGGHFTPNDPDVLGPLYVKLGMRFGMFHAPTEALQKYGVVPGSEPKIVGEKGIETYEKALAQLPGFVPSGLIYHEHTVSLPHIVRVPDLFTDRGPYQMNEAEEKKFQGLFDGAIKSAKEMRAKYPQAHLKLGNGSLPFKEEFYRHKFPAELFDSAGNESPSGSRLPEAQPPDWAANNASLWMDRQLLDAYGYTNKPVTQCYEICYANTNPGNLTERQQADYYVRHALHSLAWGVPEIRVGTITDMGNSYYFSAWGAAGFCRRRPESSVKPAFVAFATLTRVLDGAKFVRPIATGSPSVYLLEFAGPDGATVYALWTIRGERSVNFTVDSKVWTMVDDQGAEASVPATNAVVASAAPVYLVSQGRIKSVALGSPVYDDRPSGNATRLATLTNLDEWQVETTADPILERFNPLSPRRLGKFAFSVADNALKVTPQPITHGKPTMPMYVALAHRQGIPVAGRPTEVGLWVNGNSGWGRVIFEFKDATGQRWTSIGKESRYMAERYRVPGVSGFSSNDRFNRTAINFDGWRYVSFPLPGNYPGEAYGWPVNNQWRSERENVVHYPLTLTRLIFELPEKVLQVRDYAAVPRPEIFVRDLMVGYADASSGRQETNTDGAQ